MDKQAIVERVAPTIIFPPEANREVTEHILNVAGYFDLLEAAKKAHEAHINYTAAHEPDREIYRWQEFDQCMRELGKALDDHAAMDGGGEND